MCSIPTCTLLAPSFIICSFFCLRNNSQHKLLEFFFVDQCVFEMLMIFFPSQIQSEYMILNKFHSNLCRVMELCT